MITVVIVDDHRVVARSLKAYLESFPDLRVAGIAASPALCSATIHASRMVFASPAISAGFISEPMGTAAAPSRQTAYVAATQAAPLAARTPTRTPARTPSR